MSLAGVFTFGPYVVIPEGCDRYWHPRFRIEGPALNGQRCVIGRYTGFANAQAAARRMAGACPVCEDSACETKSEACGK